MSVERLDRWMAMVRHLDPEYDAWARDIEKHRDGGEQHDWHVMEWRMCRSQAWLIEQFWWQLRELMKAPVT